MIFSTTVVHFVNRLPYLGAPTNTEMAYLPVLVEAFGRSTPGHFLIDSAADSIVLPMDVATTLGINLSSAPSSHIVTAGNHRVPIRYAEVTIQIVHHQTRCRWRTWAGFAPIQRWLFGNIGGLEHFHFTLDIGVQEFLLVPRSTLPIVP